MAIQIGNPKASGATTKLDTKQPVGPAAASPKSIGTFGKSDKIDRADAGFDTNYGRNDYAGPSSVTNVAKSSDLSDFSVQIDDPALKQLVNQGLAASKSETAPALTGQERPISDAPLPTAHGMKNPNASPVKISGALDINPAQPVRKPS